MSDEHFMRLAIDKVINGIEKGQAPFGTTIVRGSEVISVVHNTVWNSCDPTAHAEVNAIREAATKLKTIDLSGCTLYTTCEPCPMCLTAIHWAKIDRVIYGATIGDAERAGFSELHLPAKDLVKRGGSSLKVEDGLLHDECAALFDRWKKAGKNGTY